MLFDDYCKKHYEKDKPQYDCRLEYTIVLQVTLIIDGFILTGESIRLRNLKCLQSIG